MFLSNRGPRSPDGKAAVIRARLKHGLAASNIVLPSEDADEWQAFHDAVIDNLGAEGALEFLLASRVAELMWRIRRVGRVEEQSISVRQMRRNLLVEDRATLEITRPKPIAGESLQDRRAAIEAQLGGYAGGMIVAEATDRYEETLPVLMPDDAQVQRVLRYEAHLSRQLNRALHQIDALQRRRRRHRAQSARFAVDDHTKTAINVDNDRDTVR